MAGAIVILFLISMISGCVDRQAEVRPQASVLTDPLATIANLKQDKPGFHIDIWTDKKRYRIGEEIRFYFRTSRDCYLTLIDHETNGNVQPDGPSSQSLRCLFGSNRQWQRKSHSHGEWRMS